MSRYVEAIVEVDLSQFDDDSIIAEATQIIARRGILSQGDSSPVETLAEQVGDLAATIAAGDTTTALILLERLVGDSRALRDAIDMGRRRQPLRRAA